jgi:Holliday junction resolvase
MIMDIENLTLKQIREKDIHSFLRKKGFATNYSKKDNENGIDIVAIKNGVAFKIELKKVVQNKTTKAYKMTDDKINGEILLCHVEGIGIVPAFSDKTSITKTVRFLKEIA